MLAYIIIVIICSFVLGCMFSKKFLIPKNNYVRISRTYEDLYSEYTQFMRGYSEPLSFSQFIRIRYELNANPARYMNKLILFGLAKNKLVILAMIHNKKEK